MGKSKRRGEHSSSLKYQSDHAYLQVLGNGAKGGATAVCLRTDYVIYLFNCGEGTVRLSSEYRIKLSRATNVFITHKSWKNLAGLVGFSLNSVDAGVKELNVYGPPDVALLLQKSRGFGDKTDLFVRDLYCRRYYDQTVEIDSYPLYGDMVSTSTEGEPDAKKPRLEGFRDIAMVYVGKLHTKRGKLLVEKCLERGVTKGSDLGTLKKGGTVTTKDGVLVRHEEVCEPPIRGPTFMVVECPTLSHVKSLVENKNLERFQTSEEEDTRASIVVHFSPPSIMEHEQYRKWISAFPEDTTHLVVNESNKTGGSVAVHRLQHQLNVLNTDIFPLLKEPGWSELAACSHEKMIPGRTMIKYGLTPKRGLQTDEVGNIMANEYEEEVRSTEGFQEAYDSMTQQAEQVSRDQPEYPVIHFLGTGSAQANKDRNSTGILLTYGDKQHVLLDCGEGTYGQLLRFYGESATGDILRHLSVVYVSHRHADHHMGLFTLLKERKEEFDRRGDDFFPVLLFGPKDISTWLRMYEYNYEKLSHLYRLIFNSELYQGSQRLEENIRETLKKSGIQEMSTCMASHVAYSSACSLVSLQGFRVTFSGDTMPTDNIVTLGNDSDILIHEATHEDGFEVDAKKKKHSTTGQAIQVGKDMNAKFTLLTHFSQRYAKIPVFSSSFTSNVGIAFDNMRVRPKDLNLLPLMHPVLKVMYRVHYQEMQDKAMKKLLKR